MTGNNPESRRIGSVTIDFPNERLIDGSGQPIALRRQSFAVLRRLAATPDQLVTKAALMDEVWPGVAVTEDSLVQCIGDIRRALGPEAEQALRTVPRRGYTLHLSADPDPAPTPRWNRRGKRLAAAMLILVAVAFVAILGGARWAVRDPWHVPIVAVMPFGDASGDHLGDAVAETVIAMLGRVPEVGVIAQRSSFALRDAPGGVRAIGAELGADYVLEGAARREGTDVRVTARLDDTATGHQVWAEQFDETGADPVALADAVADRIVFALGGQRGQLRRAEYARAWGKDTANLGEYDCAMRAQDRMFSDPTARGNAAADAILREGLARYPDSTHLKIKLAWNDWRRAYNFWSTDMAADFASATRIARELETVPNLQPWVAMGTHSLLGYSAMREGDWARVRKEADVVASLGPYDAFEITDLAETLVPAGEYERSLGYVEFGAARNPADADYQHSLRAWIYRLQGRLEESARESEAAAMLAPYQRLQYAITLQRLGREDEARAAVRTAQAEDPDLGLAAWRAATFYADPTLLPVEIADLTAAGLPE